MSHSVCKRFAVLLVFLLLLPGLLGVVFADDAEAETHTLYIIGRSDGTFRPKESLTRAELAQMIYNLGDYPDAPAQFTDVRDTAWYAKPVNALAAAEVLNGYSDGSFRPNRAVTRAELVTVLQRLSGMDAAEPCDFTDVSPAFWAFPAISLAQEMNWVVGYADGSFRPNRAVNRAEVVTVLNRYLGRVPDRDAIDACAELRFFPDVLPGSWYYYDVMEASVTHTADSSEEGENWTQTEPAEANLADGFHMFRGQLYVVENGAYVHQAANGTMDGVSYVCTGPDGVCTADALVLRLWDGELVFLKEGRPEILPGQYADGFYLRGGSLYAAVQGRLVHAEQTSEIAGISFSCAGDSGVCTVDAEVLNTVDSGLIFLQDGEPEILPGEYGNGFWLRAGNLYAAYQGNLIHTAKTAKLFGISFTCTGKSGICTVDAEVLKLIDGELIFLKNGKPEILPGDYEDGFYVRGGNLYAAFQGNLVHTAKTTKLFGITFSCAGESGICTVDAEVLKLHSGDLIFLKDGKPEILPGEYADGFYVRGGNLYAAYQGNLIHTAKTAKLFGITFSCIGESGLCTAQTQLLRLADGELALLRNQAPDGNPGSYADGFQVRNGLLYIVWNGSVLHEKIEGELDGFAFSCAGDSGVCTADWTDLPLDGINLDDFSQAAQEAPDCSFSDVPADSEARAAIALQCSLGTMYGTSDGIFSPDEKLTYAQALHACVTIYEAYFRVERYGEEDGPAYDAARAEAYGILTKTVSNYDAPIPRGDLAVMLCAALRGRELQKINEIAEVPGLSEDHAAYSAFLTLYRAGVLRGVNDADQEVPSKGVIRSDFARILNRLILPEERISFTIRAVKTIQYGTSGSGNYALTAYQLGTGPNVMVLTFAVHGWEDVWVQDGKALVYLADQTKAYLETHYDLIADGGWTVYILRCVNPDGLYDGTTCNGPGRCTTTYYNANGVLISGDGRGIDINRCFPYKYVSRTESRNFNGTAPLQCEEARALASFVSSVRGSGFNLCIDTHGWLTQIIPSSGKGTIYQAFIKQFPSSSYADLKNSSGYFSAWAYSIGYDACLFELPWGLTGYNDFLASGYVGKFELVISDLLSNYTGSGASRGPQPPDEFELDGN